MLQDRGTAHPSATKWLQVSMPAPAPLPLLHGESDTSFSTSVQVRGLVFEAKNSLGALAETVGAACRRLTDANVPHNLFIVDRGARIFLLPNAFAERKVCVWRQHPAAGRWSVVSCPVC